jgi:hypothetical protein
MAKYKKRAKSKKTNPKIILKFSMTKSVLIIFGIFFGLIGILLMLRSSAASTAKGEVNTSTVESRLLADPNTLWVGTFDDAAWEDLWGFGTFNNKTNLAINTFSGITDGAQGKALRGRTPNGQQNGFGGHANFLNMGPGSGAGIAEQEEVYLRYRVNFPSDYVWTNAGGGGHGKLPGLAGKATGGADWAVSGGGKRWNGTTMINRLADLGNADGWSARLLWQKDMGASVYLYAPNKYGVVSGTEGTDSFRAFGNATRLKTDPYNSSSANMKFNTGWNTVEQYIKMNTPGQANGVLKVWMNGNLGLSMDNVMYRSGTRPSLKITQIFWTWFYGGGTSDYPDRDSYIYFDDVVLSKAYIGARTAEPAPTPTQPDLVVTSTSWSPANPATGQPVTFSATIKNQGTGATPAGTILGVQFRVNGGSPTWSDTHTASLAAGASITLTANGGTGGSTWTPSTAANYAITANVDDVARISESNESNNIHTSTLGVAAAPAPPATTDSDNDQPPSPGGDLGSTTDNTTVVDLSDENTSAASGAVTLTNTSAENVTQTTIVLDGKVHQTNKGNQATIDTSTLTNGLHTIAVETIDQNGNKTVVTRTITINNDLNLFEKIRNIALKPLGLGGKSGRVVNMILASSFSGLVSLSVGAYMLWHPFKYGHTVGAGIINYIHR